MGKYFVYILTNKTNKVLYVGVTGTLAQRIYQHKLKFVEGFSNRYGLNKLVYYEDYNNVWEAIHREKCIKRWKREWKNALVEKTDPYWKDLYYKII